MTNRLRRSVDIDHRASKKEWKRLFRWIESSTRLYMDSNNSLIRGSSLFQKRSRRNNCLFRLPYFTAMSELRKFRKASLSEQGLARAILHRNKSRVGQRRVRATLWVV